MVKKLIFFVVQGLLQASELVNEKDLKFVKERYFEGEKSIFEPISKFNIKTSSDKEKPHKKSNCSSEREQTGVWCYCDKSN